MQNPLFFDPFPLLNMIVGLLLVQLPGRDGVKYAVDAALTSFADFNSGGAVVNSFVRSIFIVPGAMTQGVQLMERFLSLSLLRWYSRCACKHSVQRCFTRVNLC